MVQVVFVVDLPINYVVQNDIQKKLYRFPQEMITSVIAGSIPKQSP